MTDTAAEPFYRDDDEQFRVRKVDDESMAVWEDSATAAIRHALPGGINWPMIVRSLIAEVRRLRAEPDVVINGKPQTQPAGLTADVLSVVRARLANGRHIADADIVRLCDEVDRLRALLHEEISAGG